MFHRIDFSSKFLEDYYSREKVIPTWILDALKAAELEIKAYQ